MSDLVKRLREYGAKDADQSRLGGTLVETSLLREAADALEVAEARAEAAERAVETAREHFRRYPNESDEPAVWFRDALATFDKRQNPVRAQQLERDITEAYRKKTDPDSAQQPCPECGTRRGQIRGIDPTFEVWDGAFCSQCGYMPKRQPDRTSAK